MDGFDPLVPPIRCSSGAGGALFGKGTERKDMDSQNKGPGCTAGAIVAVVVVVVFLAASLALVSALSSSDARDTRSSLALERAEALQPWNIAVAIALRLLLVVAFLGLLLVGLRWLDARARTIRPDRETGQMPAYRARRGETIIDLNRAVDGKAQTALLGGKTLLLAALLFRYVLRREPPPELRQSAVTVLPPDVSPEQVQVTSQAQAVQALAAASRGGDPQQTARAARMLTSPARQPHSLPPLLVDETSAPRETQLLLAQARREWQVSDGDERDWPANARRWVNSR